jgi:hypothetical protein
MKERVPQCAILLSPKFLDEFNRFLTKSPEIDILSKLTLPRRTRKVLFFLNQSFQNQMRDFLFSVRPSNIWGKVEGILPRKNLGDLVRDRKCAAN